MRLILIHAKTKQSKFFLYSWLYANHAASASYLVLKAIHGSVWFQQNRLCYNHTCGLMLCCLETSFLSIFGIFNFVMFLLHFLFLKCIHIEFYFYNMHIKQYLCLIYISDNISIFTATF